MKLHYFNTTVAKEVGVNAAVVFENLAFWIHQNAKNGRNFKDNKYWTYTTQAELAKQLDYLTVKQVRTAIDKLTQHGYVQIGVYNKMKIDKTHWYSLTEKGETVSQKVNSDCPKGQKETSKRAKGSSQIGEAIPIINTDIKPNINLENRIVELKKRLQA